MNYEEDRSIPTPSRPVPPRLAKVTSHTRATARGSYGHGLVYIAVAYIPWNGEALPLYLLCCLLGRWTAEIRYTHGSRTWMIRLLFFLVFHHRLLFLLNAHKAGKPSIAALVVPNAT